MTVSSIVYLTFILFFIWYLVAGKVSFIKWFIDASILLFILIAVDWMIEGPVRKFIEIYAPSSSIIVPPKEELAPIGIAKIPIPSPSSRSIAEKRQEKPTIQAATFTIEALYPSLILKDAIAAATGLTYGKSDNHTLIKIEHTGRLRQNRKNPDYYYYSGGELKIRVNNQTCCCFGELKVPSTSYPGNSRYVEEDKLSTAIEGIVTRNKDFIIEKIKGCIL